MLHKVAKNETSVCNMSRAPLQDKRFVMYCWKYSNIKHTLFILIYRYAPIKLEYITQKNKLKPLTHTKERRQ